MLKKLWKKICERVRKIMDKLLCRTPPPGTDVGWRDKNNHSGLYKFFQDLIWKLTGSGKCVQKKDDKPDNPGYSDLTDPNTPVPGEYKDGVFTVRVNQVTTLQCYSYFPYENIDVDLNNLPLIPNDFFPSWCAEHFYDPPGTIKCIEDWKFLIKCNKTGLFRFEFYFMTVYPDDENNGSCDHYIITVRVIQ